jgi:hypothetical protein
METEEAVVILSSEMHFRINRCIPLDERSVDTGRTIFSTAVIGQAREDEINSKSKYPPAEPGALETGRLEGAKNLRPRDFALLPI